MKATNRSGWRRTRSAIASLAMRASSVPVAGSVMSSSGGLGSEITWPYSPNSSISRKRMSRSWIIFTWLIRLPMFSSLGAALDMWR